MTRLESSKGWFARLRHAGTVTLAAAGIVLGSATMAAAYLSLAGTGTGATRAGHINAPTSFQATANSAHQVTLSWTPPSNPTPTGYALAGTIGAGSSCTSTPGASVTSCTVDGLAKGTEYTWHLMAKDHTWSSAQVTVSANTLTPAITLTPTVGLGGTFVKVTGSGFAPSSDLTFSFTSASTTTGLTPTNCTATSTTTGTLPATPCEVTIPAGTVTGRGTVTVTDATGDTASAAFTVTVPGGLGAMTVTPTTVINGSSGNTLTFTYQATGGALNGGQVDLSVAPWLATGGTVPQTTNSSAAGYTVASTGTLAYTATNKVLKVTGLTLPVNGTFTITYGSKGAATGATAPAPSATSVPYTFSVSEASTALGTLAALGDSPVVTVIKQHSTTCAVTSSFTLPAHTTVPFTAIGGGGGAGGTQSGTPGITGGVGGAGTEVSGTLTNTTGSTIHLSMTPGCAGHSGNTAPNSGGGGYASGGAGGHAHGEAGAGGGGGGATSIEIVSGSPVVVAGGGGGGGGATSSKGGQTGATGGTGRTSTPATPANGYPGGAITVGNSGGGGGGGGGVVTQAAGGTVSQNTPGDGGTGGLSYPATTVTVGGITVTKLSYGSGTPGAGGSATIG